MRILLVEDEPSAARFIAKGLREARHAPVTSSDQRELAGFQCRIVPSMFGIGRKILMVSSFAGRRDGRYLFYDLGHIFLLCTLVSFIVP